MTYILIALRYVHFHQYSLMVEEENVRRKRQEENKHTHTHIQLWLLFYAAEMCDVQHSENANQYFFYIYRVIRLFSSSISDNFFLSS